MAVFYPLRTALSAKLQNKWENSCRQVALDDCRDRIAKILADLDHRVIVLIDDIDRLERREIQAVFKLVKLSAGFSNISYVLAFDDNVVADSLAERYGGGRPVPKLGPLANTDTKVADLSSISKGPNFGTGRAPSKVRSRHAGMSPGSGLFRDT